MIIFGEPIILHLTMTFDITLSPDALPARIPINYSYCLSAAIYKILARADVEYAAFLHDHGYHAEHSLKAFKLFTFSDISVLFRIKGDRLLLLKNEVRFRVAFHLPDAAASFIKGLFMNQRLSIGDKKSQADFNVQHVALAGSPLGAEPVREVLLRPLSPVVAGVKNERGHYDFLAPTDERFITRLMGNWRAKYAALYDDTETAFKDAAMSVVRYPNPPKSRLITIKADTPEETKIRGFMNFRLKVRGRKEALELLLNAGCGLYNAMGCGCVSVEVEKNGDKN